MILDAVFNEQGTELQADFGNKIELSYIIAKSISISKRYAVSASSVVAPTSWEEEAPTLTNATPYLWMKTLTSYVAVDGSAFNFEDGGIVVGVHGTDGLSGKDGLNGTNGKSAYEFAKDGGYTGTEEEFAKLLAYDAQKAVKNLTYTDIGAAPGGYGLGELICEIPANSVATFAYSESRHASLFSLRGNLGSSCAELMFNGYGKGGSNRVAVKRLFGGENILYGITPDGQPGLTIWNTGTALVRVNVLVLLGDMPTVTVGDDGGATQEPYEWENPPMEVGVTYRTTKRWKGKPVYKVLLNLGKLATYMDVNTGINGYQKCIVTYDVTMANMHATHHSPTTTTIESYDLVAQCNITSVNVWAGQGLVNGGGTVYLTLEYVEGWD